MVNNSQYTVAFCPLRISQFTQMSKQVMELNSWCLLGHAVLIYDVPVLFFRECQRFSAAPSLLLPFSPSFPLIHNNHAPLQSIMTVPSSCPPSASSTYHFVLHPPPSSIWSPPTMLARPFLSLSIDSQPLSPILPVVAAMLLLLLHPHLISVLFSYHCAKVKKRKKQTFYRAG